MSAQVAPGVAGLLVMMSAAMLSRAIAVKTPRSPASRQATAGAPEMKSVPTWFDSSVLACDLSRNSHELWRSWIWGSVCVGVGGVLVLGPVVAGLVLASWLGLPWMAPLLLAGRAEAKRDAAVPNLLDDLARSMRSGASMGQALGEAADAGGPLKRELQRVVAETDRGLGLVPALEGWAQRHPRKATRLAVAALCLGAETGGSNARAVEGVAVTVRQRLGVISEARALSAQARISAWVIAVAPVGFCLLAAAADPRVAKFLLASPAGWVLLVIGIGLDALGAVWMHRLTNS